MNERVGGRDLSIITTQLPYIDRRSLSEAWFSALHLASDGPVAAPERRASGDGPGSGPRAGVPRYVARDAALRSLTTAFARAAGAPRGAAAPSPLAAGAARSRRAAAAAAERARSYAPFRTSLTFGVDGERVALLLRREGTTLHVVALCRPAVAELVRRALASADLHLRAGGERVCARVETLGAGAVG